MNRYLVLIMLLSACTSFVPVSTTSDTRQAIAETISELSDAEEGVRNDMQRIAEMREGLDDHAVTVVNERLRQQEQTAQALRKGRERLQACSVRLEQMEQESAKCNQALSQTSTDLTHARSQIDTLSEEAGWFSRAAAAWKWLAIGFGIGLFAGIAGPWLYEKAGGISGIIGAVARIARGGV